MLDSENHPNWFDASYISWLSYDSINIELPDGYIYLLPIINPSGEVEPRRQYIYAAHRINRHLKAIGNRLGLSIPLTMYVSRHAWASIARSKNVPLSVISEGMGHDSEHTTRIYLASLDTMAIDRANSKILKSLL